MGIFSGGLASFTPGPTGIGSIGTTQMGHERLGLPTSLSPSGSYKELGLPTSVSGAMEANPFARAGRIAAEQAFEPARLAGERAAGMAAFRMPSVQTGFGGAQYDPVTGQLTTSLDPRFAAQSQALLGQATGAFGQMGTFDPNLMAAEQFRRMEDILAPERERARQAQESRLFAQGRLGATGGALEQEAFQSAIEQQRKTNLLQAFQEAYNRQAQLQQLGMGALGAAGQLEQMPLQAYQAGLGLGEAQAGAGARQGALMVAPYMAQSQAAAEGAKFLTEDFTDFMGGMFGAGGMFG